MPFSRGPWFMRRFQTPPLRWVMMSARYDWERAYARRFQKRRGTGHNRGVEYSQTSTKLKWHCHKCVLIMGGAVLGRETSVGQLVTEMNNSSRTTSRKSRDIKTNKFDFLGRKKTMYSACLLKRTWRAEEELFVSEGNWLYLQRARVATRRWGSEIDFVLS